MKKRVILLIVFTLMLASILTACGESKPRLNVYNWGEYINTDVLDIFEEETGIRVVYDTYATNEDLYVKMKQGGSSYDVVFPSDYMIERMIREDLLSEIDLKNIPMIEGVDRKFLDLDYDPENLYSVPYMWGTVGIIYNTTMVDRDLSAWADLWDKEFAGEVIMLNSQRDTLAVALKKLGYSMNTRSVEELEEAKKELIAQKPLVYAYLGDEVKDVMIGGEASIAVVWSGDAAAMIEEDPNLKYVIPTEGTNLWFDAMVIPKNAENKEDAEKFINFMTRPDIAAMNADYIGYSSPIPEAIKLLPEEVQNSEVAYPSDEKLENTEIFMDPKDIIGEYDRIWTEITSYQ
ncbi:MAG: ABC transporter substrate-binding protein [Tissierellia bacterium]|nr:ABC transporter substrate-binding protein [Tissierellia bacterium]